MVKAPPLCSRSTSRSSGTFSRTSTPAGGHVGARASENEIVKSFGVSRMTANRALKELRDEGVLVRIAGVGSFVADRHARAHPLEIRSIADEIRERGHTHRAQIVALERVRAVADLAEDFKIAPRSELYCS